MATTNPFTRFLIACSGAPHALLTEKNCEIEHTKYAGMGATILLTAVLAALSGGYAMSTVFGNKYISIAFGLLWGVIIFNLDRFIVSSIRKSFIDPNYSFWKRVALKLDEIVKALPRIILAVFISIVITRPLELRMFQSEIQTQISKDSIAERTQIEAAVRAEFADIETMETETNALRTRITDLQDEVTRRVKAATAELEGWGGSHEAGSGTHHAQRLAELKQAEDELKAFKEHYEPVIKTNEKNIVDRKKLRDDRIQEIKGQIDKPAGLLKRLNAFGRLTNEHRSVFLANIFILLLFILLETAPVFAKLFSNRGPFDEYLDTVEHEAYATRRKNISDINDEINTHVALNRQRNADHMRAELQLTQTTLGSLNTLIPNEVHDAQLEVARRAIAKWKNRQVDPDANLGTSAPIPAPAPAPAHP